MRLDVRFTGSKSADRWDKALENVLLDSLERFSRWVKHVCLYIEDVNGPKGGVDKQCRCVVHLRRMPPVVVQTEADNMNALIYRTANRASYSLSQKTKQKKAKRRTVGKKMIDSVGGPSMTEAMLDVSSTV